MLTRGTLIYIAQTVVADRRSRLIVVSFLVFVTVHSLPGNAFESEKVHGRALQLLLHEYGLDRPVLVQYWTFISNAVHGNFGVSFQIKGQPITPIVVRELSVSAELGGAALLVTVGLGVTFGVIAAIRQNSWVDYTLTTIAVIGYSVPSFVLACLGVLIFGYLALRRHRRRFEYPTDGLGRTALSSSSPPRDRALGLYTSGQVDGSRGRACSRSSSRITSARPRKGGEGAGGRQSVMRCAMR